MAEKKSEGRFFSTKELIVCSLFGALLFFLVFTIGSQVIAVTGIPMSGGLVNLIFALALITLGKEIVPRFGSVSIIFAVGATLAIPTISWGPPGLYKVPMLFGLGLVYDTVYFIMKQNKWRTLAAGSAASLVAIPLTYVVLLSLGLPGADKMGPMLTLLTAVYTVSGTIGAYTGSWIYEKRLKHRAFIKKLR